ncbi:protein-export chaperone SecB [Methanothermococcus sp.]|uniref:protein-export chaperone SecB n=1 Tax=Methanothermococcus sp. TaxID=2614238 RepID=UPI0025F1CCE6|nr:protein-export chaperone SecB [Methanothermococcus sp.]
MNNNINTEETPSKCALKFNDYKVKHIEFILNENFNNTSNPKVVTNVKTTINYNNKNPNKFNTSIKITLGEKSNNPNVLFYLCVELLGEFEVVESEIDKVRQFAEINAVSILFPYARALITTITANANIPPVVLPPMNIAGMMEKEYGETEDENCCKTE